MKSLAQITNPALGPELQSKFTGSGAGLSFFQGFIPAVVGLGFVIGSLIFFFVFLLGAIQWISSGGDKAALEQAKGKITNALIGIIVLFSVFAVVKVVEDFFGLNILTLDIGVLKIE